MAGAIVTAGSDCWGSPLPLFQTLHQRYDFTLDGAADESNHLLPEWWGPGGYVDDALGISWEGERPYFNPPFSLVDPFLQKGKLSCWEEGVRSVFVIKAATGKRSWREYIAKGAAQIGFICGRLSYTRPEGAVGATFDSAIVVFDPTWPKGMLPAHYYCDRAGNPLDLAWPV